MSIQGNLETFYLPSMLQMLSYEKKTGRLKIKSSDNEVQIILHEGDIVFATESRKSNRIGLLLMNNGLISQEVLDECLAISKKKNQGIGKTLVQEGHLSLKQLNTFLLKQAENSIYNVCSWESGEFVYNDAELNLKGVAGNKLNTMNLLLEASRRIDELGILKKQIPTDEAVVKLLTPKDSDGGIKLNEDEWRILSMVNGKATVRQILDQTGYDDFTGYKLLNSLLSYGKIEITTKRPTDELAAQAVSHLKSIDARQFRETLDLLGLKRSSVLRVVLSRIFRDAVDQTQLMKSLANESKRIANPSDMAELNKLRENSRIPFMKAVLELLWQSVNEPDAG